MFWLPLKTGNTIRDSVVSITVLEKKGNDWQTNNSFTNIYFYDRKGELVSAQLAGQQYKIHHYLKRTTAVIYAGQKKASKLKFYYTDLGKVAMIRHYLYERQQKKYWWTEYLNYDAAGRLTSSSYFVANAASSHPGYEHNATYEYDNDHLLIKEWWGYKNIEHFYDNENNRSYSLIFDHEFGRDEERKVEYSILVN